MASAQQARCAFCFAFGLGVLIAIAEYGYGLKFQWIEPVRMAIQSGDPTTSALAEDFSALIFPSFSSAPSYRLGFCGAAIG